MLYKCRSSSFFHILFLNKQITAQVCLPFLLNYWPWLYIVNCTGYKCLLEHNSWQSLKRQSLHIIFSVSKQLMLILAFLSFRVPSFDKMAFFSILTIHLNNVLFLKKKKHQNLHWKWNDILQNPTDPPFLWKIPTSESCKCWKLDEQHPPPSHPHPPSSSSCCRWMIRTFPISHAGAAGVKDGMADAPLGWWQELGRNRTYSVESCTLLCLGQPRNYQIWPFF